MLDSESWGDVFLLSTIVQAWLYGISLAMFLVTVCMLTRDPRRRRVNHGMIVASFTLIVLSTMEFTTNIVRLVQGHVTIGPYLPGGKNQYFMNLKEKTFVIKSMFCPVQVLILDAVVVYRAYIAWQNYWILVFPVAGWGALLATTIGLQYTIVYNATHTVTPEAFSQNRQWINARYSATMVTNSAATILLAYRIWKVNRASLAVGGYTRLGLVLRIVVETGVLYTLMNLLGLILYRVGTSAAFYVIDALPPMISIVFNMIVVRVGFATTSKLSALGIGDSTALNDDGRNARDRDEPDTGRPARNCRERDGDLGIRSLAQELTEVLETTFESPGQLLGTSGNAPDLELRLDPRQLGVSLELGDIPAAPTRTQT